MLLAAGMDTRGYRLEWPAGTQLFEIDQPDVLAFKDAVLNRQGAVPRCHRAALAADLRENWAGVLLDSGFRPTEQTAWLAEGLLIYLTAEEAGHLLDSHYRPVRTGQPDCLRIQRHQRRQPGQPSPHLAGNEQDYLAVERRTRLSHA